MKKVMLIILACLLLCGCGSAPERKKQEYCPVCDSPVEYEPDYEYAIRWLEKHDFEVIGKSEVSEFVWDYLINNREDLMDFLNDSGWIDDIRNGNSSSITRNNNTSSSTIVYWVPGGKVYHSTDKCYHIAGKSNIHSGTIEEAKAANKSRMCADCGG